MEKRGKICRFGKCKKPVIKLSQNKKDRKNFLGRVISQLPAVRKDTIFGAARKNFGSSYYVTALKDLSLTRENLPSYITYKTDCECTRINIGCLRPIVHFWETKK